MVSSEALSGRTEDGVSKKLSKLPSPPKRWGGFLAKDIPTVHNYNEIIGLSTSDFLAHINNLAVEVIESPNYRDPDSKLISSKAWERLVDKGLLSSSLGERNPTNSQEEIMQTLRILSYYDLHLGLTYGITTELAIMPLQKFGSEEQKEEYLGKIRKGEMIGLAVTELNKSGSNIFGMNSNYRINDDGTVTLQFEKQFQGLSGNAGLIVAANEVDASKKTIGLFIVDQKYINTQRTKMAGLSGISYGINRGKVTLDLKKHLMVELSRNGLHEFGDIFTKSRFVIVGMTLGHQERIEFEANNRAAERIIGEVLQGQMDVPKHILNTIKTRRVVSEAIFNHVVRCRINGKSLLSGDTTDFATEASIVKTLPSEYAFLSAINRADLMGGQAFYSDSGLQDVIDVWPFRIFEGSELLLNTQIGHNTSRSPFSPSSKAGELFIDRYRSGQNLDEQSLELLVKVGAVNKMNKVLEEVWGRISSRLFALGCLNQNDLEPGELEQAKVMLNLEISQLALEFLSKK